MILYRCRELRLLIQMHAPDAEGNHPRGEVAQDGKSEQETKRARQVERRIRAERRGDDALLNLSLEPLNDARRPLAPSLNLA